MKDTIERFSGKKVAVVGDYYLDEYIYTTSEDFSPEAPVPRAKITSIVHLPGAAGNVARAFRELGATVVAIGLIGPDREGDILKTSLEHLGIDCGGLVVDEERVTGTFSRVILVGKGDTRQHVIRLDKENTAAASDRSLQKIREAIKNAAADALFVADYDEADGVGIVVPSVLEEIQHAPGLKIGISRKNIGLFKNFNTLLVNRHELTALTKTNDLFDALKKFKETQAAQTVIVTLGEQGVAALGDRAVSLPSYAKEIVDVCGAGDSFASAYTLAVLSGAPLEAACKIANYAAAVVIAKEGTAAVSGLELIEKISRRKKIVEATELAEILVQAKKRNRKVIFTNGYFDFIHVGHVQFLEEAKREGDILIVGINSDESTRANKGLDRPLQNQNDRAMILSAFDFVDYVVIFPELTPIKIIKTLQPDLIVKGGTYAEESVVGKEFGKVKILPLFSPRTDDMIMNIKNMRRALHDENH